MEDGNFCKTKCLKQLHSKRLIGYSFLSFFFFFPSKSVMMDTREGCKKSDVQMHLLLMAKCKIPI